MKTTAINSERIGHKLNRGNGYWVSKNEDGTLTISQNGIESFANAGSLINTLGGIDATLAACETEEITAGDVLRASEGSTAPVACLDDDFGVCPMREQCSTISFWMSDNIA